jgi:hypothetical protein
VLFCSVTGDIFPKESEEQREQLGLSSVPSSKDTYLERLLTAIMLCITPAEAAIRDAAAGGEAVLLDACKCVKD